MDGADAITPLTADSAGAAPLSGGASAAASGSGASSDASTSSSVKITASAVSSGTGSAPAVAIGSPLAAAVSGACASPSTRVLARPGGGCNSAVLALGPLGSGSAAPVAGGAGFSSTAA